MPVRNKLACGCPGRGDAEAENRIVEPCLEEFQQVLACDPFLTGGFFEGLVELALENTVSVFCLLLFVKLDGVLGKLGALPGLTMLSGRKFLLSSPLSGPKIGSLNLLAILVLGPIYLAIV